MATVVSQHAHHIGRHLGRKTTANFTEISRKHMFAASNRSIIKNRALLKVTLTNFLKNLQFSISNFILHN